ncbi:MAG: hypothetical protein IPI00_13080 [Flavobacteriales bacterium]|nr:hypothetical protein [Flavobacteriales bacterium]MBP9139887.1 hypothetical protein [Flavobacteriales bacterium]HQV53596.1 hypothetical protein [Flavobacteriales bacterium]HQX31489.1 hypothetical protein [Flavobacteriales bacterium]HQX39776.1 hypothetical protein [Flavobacteriales bacterium]
MPSTHQHTNVHGVREQTWPGTAMGIGLFIGMFSLFTVAPWTLIDVPLLFRVFLVMCFAGNLLPYLRSGLWLGMERLEWFLFNLLAVGPIGTSVLLWANFFVHGTPIVTTHDVGIVDTNGTLITYNFKDNYLEGFPFARSTYKDLVGPVGRTIEITEAQGLFGYPVVLKKEVIL